MRNRTLALITTIVTLIILITLGTYAVIQAGVASLSEALPYSLSILSFFISILSSFREELFPFRLTIFADSVHLVSSEAMPPASGIAVMLLLPITFSNSGYSEGIIQTVKLVVKGEKSKVQHDFLPAVEVDMVAFMQQMKGVNATNSLGTFVGFVLEPKKSIRKHIVFSAKIDPKQPPFVWQPDIYYFELHIKVYGEKKSRKYFEIRQKIHTNVLQMLATGKAKTIQLMVS